MFDPNGSTGCLRACPFLRGWHALLCEEIFVRAPDGTRDWSSFLVDGYLGILFSERGTTGSLRHTYCG